ncbi:cytochrome P450 [Actinomadura sp. 7K507]|uniref:cytochrome P450 n=1 Tax=Actinomadura sp. 7K507 TaxID=2530365 RepID=UPI00105156AA|nr:cytochrome P450 [Actinomadura sp. 7K507]TDC97973.1 cytochrome P450 [Actinomadura sp. 7K507]
MKDFEELDFFRGDELVADPYPYFEALRGQCPVQRERHHGVLMVTGYDEAVQIYNDVESFSSCTSVTGPFPGFPVPLDDRGDDVGELIEQHRDELPFSDQLPTMDPPLHSAHRSLMMRLITPRRLKENEELMWRLADGLLDSFLDGGEGEAVNGFAAPFTVLVIADLLGMPEEDRDDFARSINRGSHAGGGIGGTEGELAQSPLEFLYGRFTAYIEDRRREPRDDVLTGLATATFPDGSMPEVGDVVRVASNVFAAGQETTVRLLGSAFKILGEDAGLQSRLRGEPALVPGFIEETLRAESPIKGDFRLARRTTTVGGVKIPAGTTVMLLNGAANRDPRHFDEPLTFDAGRGNARHHIAFGRGPHTCPGAPLARAEARVAIERLLDRTAGIRISEREHGPAGARRYHYLPTYILRGLTRLSLEFTF